MPNLLLHFLIVRDNFGDLAAKPEPKAEEVETEQVKKEEEIK